MESSLNIVLLLTSLLCQQLAADLLPIQVTTVPKLGFRANGFTTGPTGNLIATDFTSIWEININVDPPTKLLIAGSTEENYVEGTGADARFSTVSDVVLLNQTHIVVTDSDHHCLRAVNLQTKTTSIYAGLCQRKKYINGYRLEARFNLPTGMLKISDVVYIADAKNFAIRSLTLSTEKVSTVSDAYGFDSLNYIAGLTNKLIYLTVANSILEIQANNSNITTNRHAFTGSTNEDFVDGTLTSSRYNAPTGIVMLNEHLLLVADLYNHRLRVVDKLNNSVTSICSGVKKLIDGNATQCEFDTIWNLYVYEDKVLIADANRIRYLPLYSLIEEPPLTTPIPSGGSRTTQSIVLLVLSITSIRYVL